MLYKNNGGKIWWVMFRDPRRPGKFIRKSTGTEILKDARSIEQAMHLSLKGQMNEERMKDVLDTVFTKDRAGAGLPLAQLWILYERFITRRDRVPGAQLIRQRQRNLEIFLEWSEKYHPVSCVQDVSFDCAMEYADHLRRRTKLKDKSRREYIANLATIWKAAGAFHSDLKNPWTDVLPIVRDGERRSAFTREQEEAVLAAAQRCEVKGWYEACLIARWTGLRRHDVALLEWKSVDFEKGVIRTAPIKTQGYGIEVEVPMVKVLRDALKKIYRPNRKYVLPAFAEVYPRMPKDMQFSEILKDAGIIDKTITFHSWRHTFRTRLAEANVSADLAKRLGGWTQDATVQRYDHSDKTEEIRAALEITAARPSP